MPSPFKVTFFFEGFQQSGVGVGSAVGWTESWYKASGSTIEQMISDPDIDNYIKYRRLMLSSIYRISFVRVSQDDKPRRFKLRNLTGSNGMAVDDGTGSHHAQVQCAVLVDLEKLPDPGNPDEKVHHRRFLLRGLPSDLIDGNILNPASIHWGPMIKFFDFIGNKETGGIHPAKLERFSWGIRFADPAIVPNPILTAVPSTANNKSLLLTLALPIAAVRGQKFTVRGIDSPNSFNKTWTYLATVAQDGIGYQSFGTARRRLQGVYAAPGKGVLVPQAFLYGPIDQYALIGLRSKRTGRVFRQLRGRSSNR